MDCPKCSEPLYHITGLCTDRDGIREDRYCPECNTRWGCRSHGFVLIHEAPDLSPIAIENKELKIAIKQMMKLNNKK